MLLTIDVTTRTVTVNEMLQILNGKMSSNLQPTYGCSQKMPSRESKRNYEACIDLLLRNMHLRRRYQRVIWSSCLFKRLLMCKIWYVHIIALPFVCLTGTCRQECIPVGHRGISVKYLSIFLLCISSAKWAFVLSTASMYINVCTVLVLVKMHV